MSKTLTLPLANLHQRHRGVTPAISASYEEAASVCLHRHHVPPASFAIVDGDSQSAQVQWTPPDDRVQGAWANATDATEMGAYGCAIASIEFRRGLTAVRRAETGSGADYYAGSAGEGIHDLEGCLRLEVSGADEGNQAELRRRLAAKVRQVR